MEIKSVISHKGKIFSIMYREDNPLNGLEGKILQGVHAFCFVMGNWLLSMLIIRVIGLRFGGGIESGESIEEAVIREVREETNMKVLHQELIGYQDIHEDGRIVRQTRSFCIVNPIGDFVSDPDGDITEIKLIDPKDYKKYFDWGVVGDRVMEQAMIILKRLNR